VKRSIALSTPVHEGAVDHLLRHDGQEDLCFALWYPSTGASRETGLLQRLILPMDGERRVHGNASFSSNYFERVMGIARRADAGIALLHSHPAPGWQEMSQDDIKAEQGHAASVLASTGLPLVGLTLGTDEAWSARFWIRSGSRRYKREWCESVRVVGEKFRVTFNGSLLPKHTLGEELDRTVSAWGESAQSNITRLKIGVVGAGSVGSIVAETLARMGIAHIRLFDFDIVERVNLDRQLHATREDARYGRLKVDVIARQLKIGATANPFHVDPLPLSIVEPEGLKEALDCDLLFSCVDRPWARFALNFIAYAHLIPVIDGGIRMTPRPRDQGLKRGTWKAHVAAPTRRCLECLGQYNPADVTLERTGLLDDPTYIDSLPADHLLRSHQNVFAFSLRLASLEIFQFLRMIIPHPGHTDIGTQTEDFVSGLLNADPQPCRPNCPFCEKVAMGDRTGYNSITGRHPVAEKTRADHSKRKKAYIQNWLNRTVSWLKA
jgi:molybdopterin-synthase adenylyltransferase